MRGQEDYFFQIIYILFLYVFGILINLSVCDFGPNVTHSSRIVVYLGVRAGYSADKLL